MRRVAGARRLETDPVFSVHDGPFTRAQMKMDRARPAGGGDIERIIRIQRERPIVNPGQALAVVETGLTKCAPAHFLFEAETFPRDIGEGEVRKLQIVDDETRCVGIARGPGSDPVAEESQLVTELAAVRVENISGEIPPLGFELRVRVMIPRKFIMPTRLSDFPIRGRRRTRQRDKQTIQNQKSKIQNGSHSFRKCCASTSLPARQAGSRPAIKAAARIQTGVNARERHGKASRTVQPKNARLITPVSTSARQRPET